MAPRSPTQAFEPTPALAHDPDNYSPLNHRDSDEVPGSSNGGFFKGVHFSDLPSMPLQGRHSIATTNVPLLPPVSSASQIPKHGFKSTNTTSEVDITAYMEQCRRWNTQLRESHESERKAWDIERTALKARIAELERKLEKGRDPKRRSSNDSSHANLHSFQADINPFETKSTNRPRFSSDPAPMPVWKGPEFTPPVTRVFSHDDDISHLPSISEDGAFVSLSKEVSPTCQEKIENVPISVEQIDKTLDGITLKSAALASSFDTGITSPQFASPALSPSAVPGNPTDGLLQVDVRSLLSPLDEKLKRHAGHTPMAFDGTLSSGTTSTNVLTPKQERPFAPVPTARPPLRPSENSESYFAFPAATDDNGSATQDPSAEMQAPEPEPVHDPEDDPALRGPLMLDPNAETVASTSFLGQVNAKLTEEVVLRSRHESGVSNENREKEAEEQSEKSPPQQGGDDDMPVLRIKPSMNFGSAWGGDMPGPI